MTQPLFTSVTIKFTSHYMKASVVSILRAASNVLMHFLTTSVSRDSRLSELWVSPPSQGSRSFSLCSPLILPLTAASVKLSVTHTHTYKEYIFMYIRLPHTSTHTGPPPPPPHTHREAHDGIQSHGCTFTVYAGKRSCLKSFYHKLSQQRSLWR